LLQGGMKKLRALVKKETVGRVEVSSTVQGCAGIFGKTKSQKKGEKNASPNVQIRERGLGARGGERVSQKTTQKRMKD